MSLPLVAAAPASGLYSDGGYLVSPRASAPSDRALLRGCARISTFNLALTCTALRWNGRLSARCDNIESRLTEGAVQVDALHQRVTDFTSILSEVERRHEHVATELSQVTSEMQRLRQLSTRHDLALEVALMVASAVALKPASLVVQLLASFLPGRRPRIKVLGSLMWWTALLAVYYRLRRYSIALGVHSNNQPKEYAQLISGVFMSAVRRLRAVNASRTEE